MDLEGENEEVKKGELANFCFKVAYLVFGNVEAVERAMTKPVLDKIRVFEEEKGSIKIGFKSIQFFFQTSK